jgi:hypothetical protein
MLKLEIFFFKRINNSKMKNQKEESDSSYSLPLVLTVADYICT